MLSDVANEVAALGDSVGRSKRYRPLKHMSSSR
jgi:hypothetical protein